MGSLQLADVQEIAIENYLSQIDDEDICSEIMEGLTAKDKYISSKFFYDKLGSSLFEEITALDEYYPTRTEKLILSDILSAVDIDLNNLSIVELGSGDPSKITLLLQQIPQDTLRTINYYPVDICEEEIVKSVEALTQTFPLNSITGIVADFHRHLHVIPRRGCRLFCFFGSTIGNFTMEQSKLFLQKLDQVMDSGDHILLGLDMYKDIDIIERAYNDSKGITARFNLNILNVVNNTISSDFSTEDFRHIAFYNQKEHRIEMHLKCCRPLTVNTRRYGSISFKENEYIHTENSHKFTYERIEQLCRWGRFSSYSIYHDAEKWFSIVHAVK